MIRTAQILRRFTFSEWGGTENVVWNSAQALRQYDVEAEILSTSALCSCADESHEDIRIRRFPYFYPYFPLSAKSRFSLDKKGGNPVSYPMLNFLKNNDFDLYHIHAPGRIAEIVRMVAKKKHKPCILSFHGGCCDVPESEMRNMLAPLKHTFPYGAFLDRIGGWRADVAAEADALICVGANELPKLKKNYPNRKIIYLPNGVNPEQFRVKTDLSVRDRLDIPRDRKILLCVSRIDYQKNQKLLLPVLDTLLKQGENLQLLLIGPVTVSSYFQELMAEAEKRGLRGHITVVPGVPPGDKLLTAAYQQADAMILPSLHEPFGIVVLEAWSAGLPVLASRVGGLQYLIRDGDNGFLGSPDRPEDFTAAWNALKDPSVRAACIAAASEAVKEYTWTRIAGRLASFYEEILHDFRK